MRADSPVRELRSSPINEDAAIVKVTCPTAPVLQSPFAAFVVSDANRLIDVGEENLSVSNFSRARCSQDRLHRLLNHRVGEHHFNLGLRNQIHAVFSPAVDLSMPLLPAVPSDLSHRHAFGANFLK